MVVHLENDHKINRLNLIAPDGSTFASSTVATGATAVKIQILEIQPNGSDYRHYEPGTYELVAVREEDEITKKIELRPNLRIDGIQQYRGGDRTSDLGKLSVTLGNVGTAPTWVYDITYRNAPNPTANDELTQTPGVPQISSPENAAELILLPQKTQTYIDTSSPFQFTDQDNPSCEGTAEVKVIVGVATGDQVEKQITVSIGGEVQSSGPSGQYTCTEVIANGSQIGGTDG